MKAKNKYILLILLITIFYSLSISSPVFAQNTPKQNLKDFINSLNATNDSLAIEKLYLQNDKPAYFAGDTLWFKAYVLNAFSLNYTTKSGILYLELSDDSNRLAKRIMVPVYRGMAFGSIPFDTDLTEGSYTLTAYTNWMRNFGESYIFRKHFYLSRNTTDNWLINYNTRSINDGGRDKVQMSLKINQFDKFSVGLRELQLTINDGKKTWFKNKAETSQDGLLNLTFELPEKSNSKSITLGIQDLRKSQGSRKINVPILLNRPEKTDLQFMPEGGKLVAGHHANVAFKALNESGYGCNVAGKIYDSKGQELTSFSSAHAGMGLFSFTPNSGESYSARISLPDGKYKEYPLPPVNNTGITLQVNNSFKKDSCEILIAATGDIESAGRKYYLIAGARNMVCWAAALNFNNDIFKVKLDKQLFPSGIVRFLLMDEQFVTLNERMIYNDLGDQLNIQLNTEKDQYQQRDSILLHLKVTGQDGVPVQGSFSLAVTDDGQVNTNGPTSSTILSHVLINSDLKGYIEDAGYYDGSATISEKWLALDRLLLTQGWGGYEWSTLKTVKSLPYDAEEQFLIKGKVTNAFNKPVAKSAIALLSKKPFLVLDTITNEKGTFTFKGIFPVDTASFFISAKNKRGKSFNVGIEVNEFSPPKFSALKDRIVPWYVNIDTAAYSYVQNLVNLKQEQLRVTGGNLLKEVVISAKKIIKQSKNLNGPGEADLIIDEAELEKAGKTTLADLLTKRVKGFGVRGDKSGQLNYTIYDKMLHLVIDGVNTEFFIQEQESRYQYLKDILEYYDAEEIKGIEVMESSRYSMKYTVDFLKPMERPWDHAFIEVTTRGGKGPFLKKSIGTYLYKPIAFTMPKEFYMPKYTPMSIADGSDIRSTVFWAPNIITDQDGNATVKFFAADNYGTYTLIMEGADLQGHLGATKKQITIIKQGKSSDR